MRAYLVKDETTFERLALELYQEELEGKNHSSAERQSSVGSLRRGGMHSYNNSSDDSGMGGSTGSKRGRRRSNKQKKSEQARTLSSDKQGSTIEQNP